MSSRMMISVGGVLALLAGCAETQLAPTAGATEVAGDDQAAIGEVSDVEVVADGDAWSAEPVDLGRTVTPVQVTIRNDSQRSLRVRYDQFALVAPDGARYSVLPPIYIDREARFAPGYDPGFAPGFGFDGYEVAPLYGPYYSDFDLYDGPFDYDPLYYRSYYNAWPEALPTTDMLTMALPEGVIRPGGQVSGFLYFEEVPLIEGRVQFRADLVDAETGEVFGEIRIPFVAQPHPELARR